MIEALSVPAAPAWLTSEGKLDANHSYARLLAIKAESLRKALQNGGVHLEGRILDSNTVGILRLAAIGEVIDSEQLVAMFPSAAIAVRLVNEWIFSLESVEDGTEAELALAQALLATIS